ncbi:Bardet-Biedl syndrome 2 protein [Fasciola hepatica]|uniref:Bardet-Biedl syndrome 2 protein homolog n=1 Tax=Fasciola hepatica TaxID=6192 RepID=A0A4E0RWD4_FASHE|nr:Bardet-Biedl syndrome 2 protein [Fasciola hepatica]
MTQEHVSLFNKQLPFRIVPGLITAGCYDGQHALLSFVSPNGKLIVEKDSHLTDTLTSNNKDRYRFYSAPPACCSLVTGRLLTPADRDIIILGAPTEMIAYDAYDNVDLYYKEMPDGVNTMLISDKLNTKNQAIVLIGGRCSLIALDENGTEVFWTVMGESVMSLAVTEPDNALDGTEEDTNQLVIGSDDCRIRIMHRNVILRELIETEAVTLLVALGGRNFGYGLRNGTIGVYNKGDRLWRIKSQSRPMCFAAYDINQDGSPELICGWENGKVDGRLQLTGVVVFKVKLASPCAGLLVMDYGGMTNVLLACGVDGEIRGYTSFHPETQADSIIPEALLRQLASRKQVLMSEIRDLNMSLKMRQLTTHDIRKAGLNAIQADTELRVTLGVSSSHRCVNLKVTTSNGTQLRCIILFAEGLFNDESHVIHPPEKMDYASEYHVQLRPLRDSEINVSVKAYAIPSINGQTQTVFHMLQTNIRLPEFSMYRLVSENVESDWPETRAKPCGGVSFHLEERPQKLIAWINEHFILPHAMVVNENRFLNVGFECLRLDPGDLKSDDNYPDQSMVLIQMTAKGEVSIRTDHLEIAANIVQSIVRYLNVRELVSTCDFPLTMQQLKELMELIAAHQITREQMMTELADKKQLIQDLTVLAEDHRLAGNWKDAKQTYTELYHENRQLLTTCRSRTSEYETLANYQKQINLIIEQASSLRAGRCKSQIISKCRQAMTENNVGAIWRIIRSGEE